MVRFPSPRAEGMAYEQQRKQHNNRYTHASRLLGHTGQVCPTLIPIGHSGETSQDDSLHKLYTLCSAFIGKPNFFDNLREIYDRLFEIDAEPMDIPEDYYTSIAIVTQAAGEGHTT